MTGKYSNAELTAELERLRQTNGRMSSTIQELRLEIAYYQGEAKRHEWEKELVKQELKNVTSVFKNWAEDVRSINSRPKQIFDDPGIVSRMVGASTKVIAGILQLGELNGPVLLATCESPFTIEYVNAEMVRMSGFDTYESCGMSCWFIRNELQNCRSLEAFSSSITEVGYAHLYITDYRKDGSSYTATATVFPVYDIDMTRTVCELTHFAVVFSNIVEATITATLPSLESRDSSFCANICSYSICSDDFIALTATARLSDVLKFSMRCKDALVITDMNGRILHVNKSWQELYGYAHCEIESLLLLDVVTRQKHSQDTIISVFNASKTFQFTSDHCSKNGEYFSCTLTIVPVQGMIKLAEATHFVVLIQPVTKMQQFEDAYDDVSIISAASITTTSSSSCPSPQLLASYFSGGL